MPASNEHQSDFLRDDPELEPLSPEQSNPAPGSEGHAPQDSVRQVKTKSVPVRRYPKEKIIKIIISLLPQEADGLVPKSSIIDMIRKQYGIKRRTIEKLFSDARARARAMVSTDTAESKADHVYLAYNVYCEIIRVGLAAIRNPSVDENGKSLDRVSARDILDAQGRKCRLLGLDKPQTIAVTDPTGGVSEPLIAIRQAVLVDPEIRKLAAELAEKMAGLDLTKRIRVGEITDDEVHSLDEPPEDALDGEMSPYERPIHKSNGVHRNEQSEP